MSTYEKKKESFQKMKEKLQKSGVSREKSEQIMRKVIRKTEG